MNDRVTFQLNKVVRDKVLEDMLENGQEPEYRELSGTELLKELVSKVQEEASELDASDPGLMKELMDVQTAIFAILSVRGVSRADFQRAVDSRNDEKGEFKHAYYIGRLTLSADDPWVEYYRQEPSRYPEINNVGSSS